MATKKTKLKKKPTNSKKRATKKKPAVKAARKSKKSVSAIPKGYHSVTPFLVINDASNAIEFYKKAFDAKEVMRMEQPNGKIAHAELKIGNAKLMLAEEYPERDACSPKIYGGSPVSIHLYVKKVDTIVEQAVAAGAKLMSPVEDRFYGDRNGLLEDPYGHRWCVSTRIENVTPAQMKKRAAELFGKQ